MAAGKRSRHYLVDTLNILSSEMVVFVSPLYWFGFSAQLKTVIDRFYSMDIKLHSPKKAAFLFTHLNNAEQPNIPLEMTYGAILTYLGWQNCGIVQAGGLEEAGAIRNSKALEQAWQLGKNIS